MVHRNILLWKYEYKGW